MLPFLVLDWCRLASRCLLGLPGFVLGLLGARLGGRGGRVGGVATRLGRLLLDLPSGLGSERFLSLE